MAASSGAETLPNLRIVAEGIYVGGEPAGDRAWDELRRLGVQTVVSVDGIPPDSAAARGVGARLFHVPIGYDGVSRDECAALATVASGAARPIYVHCHHGRHRGPAAAAVIARAAGLLDRNGAIALLRSAGTDPAYGGLWRDVAGFAPAEFADASVSLSAASDIGPLALAMAQLDRAWRRVRVASASVEAPEWRLVREALRESLRAAEDDDVMREVAAGLRAFEEELTESAGRDLDAALNALEARCAACHADWRD